jgi:hypothetical protein
MPAKPAMPEISEELRAEIAKFCEMRNAVLLSGDLDAFISFLQIRGRRCLAQKTVAEGPRGMTLRPFDGTRFRAALKKLKHGKSIDLSCLYIKFGYSASADVEIEYRIYADNIPSVGNGKITVHVTDSSPV